MNKKRIWKRTEVGFQYNEGRKFMWFDFTMPPDFRLTDTAAEKVSKIFQDFLDGIPRNYKQLGLGSHLSGWGTGLSGFFVQGIRIEEGRVIFKEMLEIYENKKNWEYRNWEDEQSMLRFDVDKPLFRILCPTLIEIYGEGAIAKMEKKVK